MNVQLLDFQKSRNFCIVQFQTNEQNSFDYISSEYAIKNNLIEIKEVSESGSVNNLFVLNYSNHFVFFMDGDILIGSKQNRVLNTSVLIAPNSKTIIPVSCVEAGRWRYTTSKFSSEEYIAPVFFRRDKTINVNENLKSNRKHYAKQNEVWENVNSYCLAFRLVSNTNNLSDIYYKKKNDIDSFKKEFSINDNANGLAVLRDNILLGIDIFNKKDIYKEYFPKILKGIAMEVFNNKKEEKYFDKKNAFEKVLNFFDDYDTIIKTTHDAVGVGSEKRFVNQSYTGFELNYENHLIHLNAVTIKKKF